MALCSNTFFWTDKNGRARESPCGKCWRCLQNKRKEWAFRAFQESKNAYTQAFITLTYNPYEVPSTGEIDENGEEIFTLAKTDLKAFFMRLSVENGRMNRAIPLLQNYGFKQKKMTYYGIGEYGDRFERPHYHFLVFNFHPDLKQVIEKKWDKGFVHIGKVTAKSINYVTSYVITKNAPVESKQPPFALISKGFGAEFVQSALKTLQQTNELYVINNRGKRVKMPRYYRDKILTTPELKVQFNHQVDFENQLRLRRYDLIDECEKRKIDPFIYETDIRNADIDKFNSYNKKRKK